MAIEINLSGLENLVENLTITKSALPAFDAAYMTSEFDEFVDINASDPNFPDDTGDMLNAFNMTTPTREVGVTRARWENLAEYASFVNDGTIHISPRYFWQKGMSEAEEQRESRYQDKFAEKFKG